jgi:outer membrane immunogenic protein
LTTEAVSLSSTKVGYAVGAGVEAGLWGNWTLKAEYLYVDFGTITGTGLITAPPAVLAAGSNNNPFTHSFDLKANIARVGLNYRFGGPVVAKY